MLEQQAKKNKKLKSSALPCQDSVSDVDNFSLHDDSDLEISSDNDDSDQGLHLQLGPVTSTIIIKQDDYVLVAF